LLGLLTLLVGGIGPEPAQAQVLPPDVAPLDGYLERLGLGRLRIRHLERELERPHQGNGTPAIAVRLAEVYADCLLTATDPKVVSDMTDRLSRLVKSQPKAGTPRVRLTLIEGDYNRAEIQALKWVGDPSHESARTDALARLGRCRPELDQARDELLKQVKRLDDQAMRLLAGAKRDAIDRELLGVKQISNRATYFASWANFYESLLAPGVRSAGFGAARQGFRLLLELDDITIKTDDIPSLDAEVPARIGLGLALAELCDNKAENAREVFLALSRPDVHQSVRDWVDRWQVWALLQKGRNDDAEAVARAAINRLAPPFTTAKAALCSVLIRGIAAPTKGAASAPAAGSASADRIAVMGISGMIRLGRPDLARRLLGNRDLSGAGPNGALVQWLRGQAAMRTAEGGRGAEGYRDAQAAFSAALTASGEPRDKALDADCRFGNAWCLYRLGESARARDEFRKSVAELKALGLPFADAEWMALVTGWSLAEDDPAKRIERITTEARAFRLSHPDHPGAGQADELVARLKRELAPPEELTRERPKDPASQLTIARKLHHRWAELSAAERGSSPLTAALADIVRDALPQSSAANNPAGRIQLLLVGVDLALAAEPPDRERAGKLVNEASTLAAKLLGSDPAHTEVRFRQFQLARANNDRESVREHARWLLDHPGADSHARTCLTALAEQADESARTATAADRKARAAEALEIHRRLAGAISDFPDRVRTNPTLRLVYHRMARYALDADQAQAALRYVSPLRLAKPDDPEFLRLEGLANSRAGNRDRALECWHELLDRLPRNSASWFEAKFCQIDDLARVSPERARRAWEQFQILHPELGPDPWPARFRELAARL